MMHRVSLGNEVTYKRFQACKEILAGILSENDSSAVSFVFDAGTSRVSVPSISLLLLIGWTEGLQ